ncbi:MAG: ComEC/Rec2 family competence protein [Bacteroidales bacterium]|nr:ComEC/Rec2 family competence protein [Bacteroidales bacterium]
MRKGRYIVLCASAFLAGDLLGGWVPFPAGVWLAAVLLFTLISLLWRSWALIVTVFVLLGATALQCARLPALPAPPSRLEIRCRQIQQRCAQRIERFLDAGAERAVAKALAFGDKSELARNTRAAYRASGASHLLALSGLHVGILYKLLVALLFPLALNLPLRRLRSLLVILLLWGYAALSGLSPSISRAALMITIYEGANLIGRRSDGLCSLGISALIITLLNPEAPREIGFQLSFAACLGIFLFHPWLSSLLKTRLRSLRALWSGATLAISCQLTCALPVWLYFHSFPRYFLLTNLLTLPVVTAVLYLTVFCLLLSIFDLPLGFPALVLQKCLQILNYTTSTIADLKIV